MRGCAACQALRNCQAPMHPQKTENTPHPAEAFTAVITTALLDALESRRGQDAIRRALSLPAPATPADVDLLSVTDAAKRLSLGVSTVRRLASKCELSSVKVGRRLLFRPADLDVYTEARLRSPQRVRELVSVAAA